jgi:hypothetical protein
MDRVKREKDRGADLHTNNSHNTQVVDTDEMGCQNSDVYDVVVATTVWGLDRQIRDDMCLHETSQYRRYLWPQKSDVM